MASDPEAEARRLERLIVDLRAELIRQGFELRRLARQLDHSEHHYAIPTVRETPWHGA
jgi:hypothetical protein